MLDFKPISKPLKSPPKFAKGIQPLHASFPRIKPNFQFRPSSFQPQSFKKEKDFKRPLPSPIAKEPPREPKVQPIVPKQEKQSEETTLTKRPFYSGSAKVSAKQRQPVETITKEYQVYSVLSDEHDSEAEAETETEMEEPMPKKPRPSEEEETKPAHPPPLVAAAATTTKDANLSVLPMSMVDDAMVLMDTFADMTQMFAQPDPLQSLHRQLEEYANHRLPNLLVDITQHGPYLSM